MLALAQGNHRFRFPLTTAEFQVQMGNEIETFTIITGEEMTSKKPVSKAKRVSFQVIVPRRWEEIWESGTETIKYKSPEQFIELMDQWKGRPVVVLFYSVFSKTMLIENIEVTYKDGQGNLHVTLSFVEYKPVKIVTYSNTKQLLKPGLVITKPAKSRANTTTKKPKKNERKNKDKKKNNTNKDKKKDKKKEESKMGNFDYAAQKKRMSQTIERAKGGK
ncbi:MULTISPECIES: hypothetical protein [Aneurinibacillus]|uniref:Uncharacterized protein n=1 Tax=Aneurinibacillus thermoaerophilus TaxID=143495 RepID=A0ABX8YDK3_ANETH|nr:MULTISPECIES: hypothetical protein [Aneurinibacillus]AMA74017.1 hypothetical protein ACH33_15005 [Aneurinibacillus sp. XH2]MED0675874.1 hypothetical protein [Aneurinibacillus thermoaerophilus]MED0737218.1 hypothetical protein [Aneurinibacillus thermoaerophilus]QYY43399.1 hypothetical protein K3F53_03865 [Aneurinibacillus thermoaerophilus]